MGFLSSIASPFKAVGSAVGGVVGGIVGGIAGAAPKNTFQATPYTYDKSAYGVSDRNQMVNDSQIDFINQLRARYANPNATPTSSNLVVDQAQQNNLAAANALANSQQTGGVNPALAYRIAQQSIANSNQTAAQTGAIQRQNEIIQSQNTAANALNANYATNLGNANTQEAHQIQLQEDQQKEQARVDALNSGIQDKNVAAGTQFAGGVLSAGASLGAAAIKSDKNAKKNIESEGDSGDLQNFLDKLKAYKYDYKDSSDGKGKQYSVMAQDLEKSPVGKAMVKDTSQGKMVDYGKGFGAILAAQAELNQRMKRLESKGAR